MPVISETVLRDRDLFRKQFDDGKPYRNVVIDNFLDAGIAQSLYEHFPKVEEMRKHYSNLNEKKSEGSSFDVWHPDFNRVREAIMGPEFTAWMEDVTGFKPLVLPDDHRGSGLHQGTDGSYLDIHVDFSIHPIRNIHRRLNLLIFLNPGWKKEYGGLLELWDPKVERLEYEIMPSFNRAAIFECNDVSYHGYDKISVPDGITRKSFFAYYYTPIQQDVKYHDTIFKPRPSDTMLKKTQTAVKESSKNLIKKSLQRLGLKSLFEKFE